MAFRSGKNIRWQLETRNRNFLNQLSSTARWSRSLPESNPPSVFPSPATRPPTRNRRGLCCGQHGGRDRPLALPVRKRPRPERRETPPREDYSDPPHRAELPRAGEGAEQGPTPAVKRRVFEPCPLVSRRLSAGIGGGRGA